MASDNNQYGRRVGIGREATVVSKSYHVLLSDLDAMRPILCDYVPVPWTTSDK
jgi:hypothetical protein